MNQRHCIIGIAFIILSLLIAGSNAFGCGDVEGVISGVAEATSISGKDITITDYNAEYYPYGNNSKIVGPITITPNAAPCLPPEYEWMGCEGQNAQPRPLVQREWGAFGPGFKIDIEITSYDTWCGANLLTQECLAGSNKVVNVISFYTPEDDPHPILNYLDNYYKKGECIGPMPPKYGPRPDEGDKADETKQGVNPNEKEPADIHSEQGEPISIYNGNNIHFGADLKFDSPFEGSFIFNRRYNSRFKIEDIEKLPQSVNAFGFGWTHTYNAAIGDNGYYLIPDETDPNVLHRADYLVLMDETGRTIHFRKDDPFGTEYYGTFDEPTKVYLVDGNYEWHRSDGRIFIFQGWEEGAADSTGPLLAIVDPNGNRQSLTYDANNLLETVTDEATGRVLTFHYNANGLLDHIAGPVTDGVPDGIWVTYGYDANGNLTTVSYADGSGRIYEYNDPNDPHNLTAEKDQDGEVIFTWTYDNQDRGISNTTNDDRSVIIDYINDTTIDVTNAYGVTHTYGFENLAGQNRITAISGPADCPNCGEDVVRYAYDAEGRIEEVEYVNGRVDRYEDYDSRGNAQTEILDYGGPYQATIQTVFHPNIDKPLSRTQASVLGTGNKETIWDYDDDGNTVPNENPTARVYRLIERGFTLDAQGNTTAYEYITSLDYNSKGQVISINGPRPGDGDTITYAYDSASGNLESMTLPLVGTTYYNQYDAAGNLTSITDPNGIETSMTYDGRNRLLTVTRNGHTTSTTYTLAGKPDVVTDAAGRTMDFQYDPKNFLERITDPSGNYRSFGYTALGNTEEESAYTSAGTLTKILRYEYGDPLNDSALEAGKPWKAIRRNHDDSADLETIFGYDAMGNLASVTDAESNTTTYLYDNFNRLACTEQPGLTVTDYEYDAHGNLISITDPEGLVTQYLYDDMGRQVSVNSSDTGLTLFAYDAAGNMVQKEQNAQVTEYSYDDLNRQTAIAYADGTPGVTYTYDSGAGNHLLGRLAGVTDASGQRNFSYDADGYPETEQRIINGVTYTTGYDFDPAGNLRQITYPTGQVVDYLPGATDPGLVGSVRIDGSQDLATGLAYKPFGPVAAMTLGNALQVSMSYDKNYNVTAIAAGGAMNRTFASNGVGNITAITDNLDPSRNQSFTYNNLHRLTHATGVYGNIDFTYDMIGNRMTRTASGATDTYSYLAGTNRIDTITGSATVHFDHDPHGNLVGRTYVSGQAPNSTGVPDYTYTHDGQRVIKSMDGQGTVFHYDLGGQVIAETDSSGDLVKGYIWLLGQPFAQFDAGGAVYYYHNDHLGTPQRMTDGSGGVVWAADYLPFGRADVTVEVVRNDLRFAGQYYDHETGLHYNYHRYYDPSLGRYLRADPIGLEGGVNLYAYVQNNPVNSIDPLGLWAFGFGGGGDAYAIAGAGGTVGATIQRFWGTGFKDGLISGGETVTSFQGPIAAGLGLAASANLTATFSPFGSRDTILGDSITIGGTGGLLGDIGVSIDFPLGNGFWSSIKNFSITVSGGFGAGAVGYATVTNASGECP